MKNKTALKQSTASVKFLAIAIAVMSILTFKYPSVYTIVLLIIFVVYFWMDAAIILSIRRKARQDPGYLDKKLTDKHGRPG